jgi:hypothetical protein
MGLCTDKSTQFLRGLGYNVVRHPRANFRPLLLLGRQNKSTLDLGGLEQLITNPPGPVPPVTIDQPAAGINGQSSSEIKIGIGASILGSLIGAMGGTLGINVSYTDARKISFQYSDVLLDSVVPLSVGNYLRDAEVDAGNLILEQYVLGEGELFLVTTVAKSKKFTVTYERSSSTAATVNVPALQQLAGANVQVSLAAGSQHVVSFQGPTPLAFAFQCLRVGVDNGVLTLSQVPAGGVAAAVGAPPIVPELLNDAGLLDLR